MPPDRPRLYVHRLPHPGRPRKQAELAAPWPMKRFPLLVDGDRTRVVDEARPFRNCFPLGAPDRD